MRSAGRFVAILALVCSFVAGANAQEGGFQTPTNAQAGAPIPTGQAGLPGFYTSSDFVFSDGRVVVGESRARLNPPKAPPKPGEHLGEYMIAEQLPSQTLPLTAPSLPETITQLPPVETRRFVARISWYPGMDEPAKPQLGTVPPKPGESLGEYAIAGELPSHPPVPELKLATMAMPPGYRFDIGHRFSGPSGAPTIPTKAVPDSRTSIQFSGPAEMKVTWQSSNGPFSVTAPKEYNFVQGKTYRLRLTQVSKGKPDEAFYPTIEIAPATPKTQTFLAHASVPVTFTADEFAQARAGQLVVKVLYLPDPVNQDFGAVGAEEVVSTRLEPGTDPLEEAARRGTILAVIRLGNIDPEARSRPRSEER